MDINFDWQKGTLTLFAKNIFTDGFYEGVEDIYYAVYNSAPYKQRVACMSRKKENSLRILTPELATHFIKHKEEISQEEKSELNSLCYIFREKF